eukprot:CAMPEP_0179293812 /NCGR_PEP_ID=MMETSP0797-20121207/43568_1 /TAXON_ID=47934 /ORGANISM="Dinophysis acuminata, Strain DAEP01" /LENGTH=280 /DNA_ID=CAMNT_0021002975 /DNA_START=87 /DNA_END=927 /DNA_ORIENTATION=+
MSNDGEQWGDCTAVPQCSGALPEDNMLHGSSTTVAQTWVASKCIQMPLQRAQRVSVLLVLWRLLLNPALILCLVPHKPSVLVDGLLRRLRRLPEHLEYLRCVVAHVLPEEVLENALPDLVPRLSWVLVHQVYDRLEHRAVDHLDPVRVEDHLRAALRPVLHVEDLPSDLVVHAEKGLVQELDAPPLGVAVDAVAHEVPPDALRQHLHPVGVGVDDRGHPQLRMPGYARPVQEDHVLGQVFAVVVVIDPLQPRERLAVPAAAVDANLDSVQVLADPPDVGL